MISATDTQVGGRNAENVLTHQFFSEFTFEI